MGFFNALNFSSSNEDGLTELVALQGPAQRMLCLTGSGTRPLDMLLSDTAEVIAVDVNPIQNALLRLKIAAFETLSHSELLAYLGITQSTNRRGLHQRVGTQLSSEDQAFWDKRIRQIDRGIWYAGRWEKVLRLGAAGNKLIRRQHMDALFDAETVGAQSYIWATHFDDRIWRGSIRLLGRPWIWTKVIGEPGGAFLPSPKTTEARLADAFTRAAGAFLFRESDFASLILRGTNALPDALPLHLLPQNFDAIRAGLPRLRVIQSDLTTLRKNGIQDVDRFSLSDFGSYCDTTAYAACWDGITAVATSGARYCERIFMNPLPVPNPQIEIDDNLSFQLTTTDKAIIYDIRAGVLS